MPPAILARSSGLVRHAGVDRRLTMRRGSFVISLAVLLGAAIAEAQTPPTTPPPPIPPTQPANGQPVNGQPANTPPGYTGPAPKKVEMPPPPPATVVAASVNGQPIPEIAVYRAFLHDPAQYNAENRKEMINHLVENMLVDQYLFQLKIEATPKEVDERYSQIDAEAKKNKQELKQMLGKMFLTEDDLRRELVGSVRWEKFLAQQATEKVLKELFDKNPAMFNGSQVSARHILLANKGPESIKEAVFLKTSIEKTVDGEVAKLPAATTPIAREQERAAILLKTFASQASEKSTCPSKLKGGELGYFPRVGAMVEPFARAAFALKPYQISEPIETQFGVHLILAVDIRPGREVKFDQARPFVQEVYGERLREAIINAYRPRSKIEVNELAK
jgi:parvulin-like peptidyl-prolyl isomerase